MDHDKDKHDDMVQALGFAVTALLERSVGGGRMFVPTGDAPRVQLTPNRDRHEPPPAVVRPGEERPTDRLVDFWEARRHPRYIAPGSGRR